MATNTVKLDVFDALQNQVQPDGMNEQVAKNQMASQLQEELLQYSPEEMIEELNAESETTGLYGFEYLVDADAAADIPGMTAVSYQIPDDPNGGVYVGYESYEQTFAKAQEEYQSIISGGNTPTAEQETAFADATQRYSEQKSEYESYLSDTPGAPDYLSMENPVTAYAEFEIPRLEKEAMVRNEQEKSASSVSMDDVASAMEQGETGTVVVGSAAMSGRYAENQEAGVEAESVSSPEYVARISDEVDAVTIMGMANYQSQSGAELPQVSSPVGTEEYGREVVERLKVIDAELASQDANYESAFPSGVRYYADGENPEAIPGMTLVVGKIEGAPGFYAGYETYDMTYRNALNELDAESAELESLQDDPNADMSDVVNRQEANQAGYESANAVYDMQKSQYEEYVDKNPGNDFIKKDNPVDSFHGFQNELPVQQQSKNFMANVKEFLMDRWEDFKNGCKVLGAKISGQKDKDGLSAEQAQESSVDYWAKRAEMSPDDAAVQEKYQTAMAESQGVGQASSGNPFRDIVQNGMSKPDMDYEYQHNMSVSQDTYVAAGSTGNQLLDELSMGSTGTIDSMVENMPDSGESAMNMDTVAENGVDLSNRRLPEVGVQADVQRESSKSNTRSASVSERLSALSERLAAGAASEQEAQFGA